MDDPIFRMVCPPATLHAAPQWGAKLLAEGHLALSPDAEGLDALDKVAHALELNTVRLMRREGDADAQEQTVIRWAEGLPLLWVAASFSESARTWARERGPMTLLVEGAGALLEDEQRRIDRFVAFLGRQAE